MVKRVHCVGFIDGTKVQIAHPGGPGVLQRAVYSGHNRMYFLVYQSITIPNWLVSLKYGLVEGRPSDTSLYRESKINAAL